MVSMTSGPMIHVETLQERARREKIEKLKTQIWKREQQGTVQQLPWFAVEIHDWVLIESLFFIGNSTIDRSAEVGFQSVSVIQGIWRWWHRPLCHVFLVSQPLFWLPCFKMLKYRLNPDKDILKHRTSYVNQRIFFGYVCITQHQMISSDLPD